MQHEEGAIFEEQIYCAGNFLLGDRNVHECEASFRRDIELYIDWILFK